MVLLSGSRIIISEICIGSLCCLTCLLFTVF
nr:MAG TPA: hypothetical protein [Caudoviricetes sp.]